MGSGSGCLPSGIPCGMAMPCHSAPWWPHRVSVTNCFTGAWAAVSCARLAHTRLTCSLALFTLPPLHTLQSHSPTSDSQPWQQIPVTVSMPCKLALQKALIPAGAGLQPAMRLSPSPTSLCPVFLTGSCKSPALQHGRALAG